MFDHDDMMRTGNKYPSGWISRLVPFKFSLFTVEPHLLLPDPMGSTIPRSTIKASWDYMADVPVILIGYRNNEMKWSADEITNCFVYTIGKWKVKVSIFLSLKIPVYSQFPSSSSTCLTAAGKSEAEWVLVAQGVAYKYVRSNFKASPSRTINRIQKKKLASLEFP